MFGIADYGAFVVAIIIFLAIPGPGNLALITSTSKGGLLGGMAATLGVIAGDQVLMWMAVAGVAALLSAYPTAFNLVQWMGAAYLAWLGFKMLLAQLLRQSLPRWAHWHGTWPALASASKMPIRCRCCPQV